MAVVDQHQPLAPTLDLWLALLAGERVWADEGERPGICSRAAASLEIITLLYVLTLLWATAFRRVYRVEEPLAVWIGAAGATVAIAVIARDVAGIALGRAAEPARFGPRVVWRGAAFLVVVLALLTVVPTWSGIGAVPLGVVAGADASLTAWALGIQIRARRWWWRFLSSPLHLGALGALTAMVVLRSSSDTTWRVLALYAAMQLGVVVALGTLHVLDRLNVALLDERERERLEVVDAERRLRVHWLHDDVLSEIRLTTLRLQSGEHGDGEAADAAASELLDLDHRLRLRQVDELLHNGEARLADLLQPHVRRAQSLGVTMTEVPSLDAAGVWVDVRTGRLFARAVSGLMSNAINAGARHLGLQLAVTADAIELAVTDDAGGFELADIPAGRGLDGLITDLGAANLTRVPAPGGSTVRVRIPCGRSIDRRPNVPNPRG